MAQEGAKRPRGSSRGDRSPLDLGFEEERRATLQFYFTCLASLGRLKVYLSRDIGGYCKIFGGLRPCLGGVGCILRDLRGVEPIYLPFSSQDFYNFKFYRTLYCLGAFVKMKL